MDALVREAYGGAGGGGLGKMLGGTLGGPGALSNAGALGGGRAYGTGPSRDVAASGAEKNCALSEGACHRVYMYEGKGICQCNYLAL